jgi:hypothetical protein
MKASSQYLAGAVDCTPGELFLFNLFPIPKGLRALGSRVFPQLSCQKLSFPEGEIRGAATAHQIHLFGGAARVTSATFSTPVSYPSIVPMGWQQYSRL